MPTAPRSLTEAQRAYESKRAAKAGMSLEKWLAQKNGQKNKQVEISAREQEKTRKAAEAKAKPPGFLSRLLERAQKPL